jgi:hypothetical protein
MSAGDIEVCEVIRHVEKHVLRLVQALETCSVVWEVIARVGG